MCNRVRRIYVLVLSILALSALPASALQADYREVLPNGVTLQVCQTLASPTVSINIFVKVGSFEEDSQTSGITHFFEHLFFRGTPKWKGYEFKRRIEALGGMTNAETTRDMTHFFVNLPKDNLKKGMEMMADAFINASLDSEAIDQERKAVLEEYNMGLDNPQRIVYDRLCALAYGDQHPYSAPVIGTEDNIRRFQRADFQRFREMFYTPERTVVTIVGDVNPAEVLPLARQSFGAFTRTSGRPLRRAVAVNSPEKVVEDHLHRNMNNSLLLLGFPGPSVHDKPDIYRLDVASFLLGVGRGSIVNRDVVDSKIALSAGVDFMTQRFSGIIVLYAISTDEKLADTRNALLSATEKLKAGEITERDLKRAKNFLKSSFRLSCETNAGKAQSLGFYATIGEEKFPTDYCEQLDKVTIQDVRAVANKYFTPSYYAVTLNKTPEEIKHRSRLDDFDGMGRPRRPGSRWL